MERPDRTTDPEGYRNWMNANARMALDWMSHAIEAMRDQVETGQPNDMEMIRRLVGVGTLAQDMTTFFRREVEIVIKETVESHRKYACLAEDLAPQLVSEVEDFLSTSDRPGI